MSWSRSKRRKRTRRIWKKRARQWQREWNRDFRANPTYVHIFGEPISFSMSRLALRFVKMERRAAYGGRKGRAAKRWLAVEKVRGARLAANRQAFRDQMT